MAKSHLQNGYAAAAAAAAAVCCVTKSCHIFKIRQEHGIYSFIRRLYRGHNLAAIEPLSL